MKKIFNLAKKEFIQTFRDKKMLPVIFVAPVIQLILLGYAVTTDVKHIYLAVIDRDNSVESRELVGAALNSGYFDLKQGVEKESEIEEALRSGKADFVLYVPPNYSKNIKMNKKASFQVIADGSDATLTGIGLNYLNEIVQRKNKEIRDKIMNSRAGLLGKSISFPRVSPEVKIMYNPMLTTFMFIFPAMILSGFVFPVTNMPEPAQYLTYLIPLRYFLTIIRGIILKGNGIEILWPEIAALIIFGVVIFTLSSMRFRKKLG